MVKSGTLIKLKGNRYTLPAEGNWSSNSLPIRIAMVVIPEKKIPNWKDVFIPARYLSDAMDGDRVMVTVEESRRGIG
jgi:hypothetical protein